MPAKNRKLERMQIIVNSMPFSASSWQERSRLNIQISPAGIHPEVQRALDAAAVEINPIPQDWDVCFECEMPLNTGANLSVKEDGREFKVIHSSGRKHWAKYFQAGSI